MTKSKNFVRDSGVMKKIIPDSVDKSDRIVCGEAVIDKLIYFPEFDKNGSVIMTVKILKYDYIVLCLFEKVDDFINVHIEKRRGRRACCNGTFQYVNFINTYTPIKYPCTVQFLQCKE
nr:hypothetical protein [Escherichia coli]